MESTSQSQTKDVLLEEEAKELKGYGTTHEAFVGMKKGDIKADYDLDHLISKTTHCSIFFATHKNTGTARAIKIFEKGDEAHNLSTVSHMEILKTLDHPNVETIFEMYEDEKHYYIVMEIFWGRDLLETIMGEFRPLEKRAASYFKSIMSAISYLHSKGVAHRDIKADRIFFLNKVKDSALKISHFYSATRFKPGQYFSDPIGLSFYVAPEVLKGNYNEKCDVWSAGVILYILLCGYPPFDGKTEAELKEAILNAECSFDTEEWEAVSDEGKALVSKMLNPDFEKRVTAAEVLNDAWFKQFEKEGETKELNAKALQNLKKLKTRSQFQQLIMSFIATQIITPQEKEELRKVFADLDTSKNGRLSKEEITKGLEKLTEDYRMTEKEIDELFEKLDADGSGEVEYTEFIVAAIDHEILLSKEKLEQAFKLFDTDGNGQLSFEELDTAMAGIGLKAEDWKDILGSIDKNDDGRIGLKEFVDFMLDTKIKTLEYIE